MERRAIPRKPVLISGEFAGSAINCLIRNISIGFVFVGGGYWAALAPPL